MQLRQIGDELVVPCDSGVVDIEMFMIFELVWIVEKCILVYIIYLCG